MNHNAMSELTCADFLCMVNLPRNFIRQAVFLFGACIS